MNRRVIDVVGHQLYAPTPGSRANLAREHLGGQIPVTGNTVIDALQQTVQRTDADPALRA